MLQLGCLSPTQTYPALHTLQPGKVLKCLPWLWWWWHQEGVGGGGQVREIIVYLLVAAGIDPVTHVRVQHDAEDEDHQPDENNNNTVEIEEHFVEDAGGTFG